jgi:uncharacterized membrane protein YesL
MVSETMGTVIAIGSIFVMFGVFIFLGYISGDNMKKIKRLIVNISVRCAIMVLYFILIYNPFISEFCENLQSSLLSTVITMLVPVIVLGPTFYKMINIFSPTKPSSSRS